MKVIVPDMSCKHCVMKIQKQLMVDGIQATVELNDKSVTLKKDTDLEKAKQSILKAGYQAE